MDWLWEKTLGLWRSFFNDDKEDNDSAIDSAPLPTTSPVPQTIKRKSRRIREVGLVGLNYLDVLKSQRLISGKRVWDSMDEKQRSPYLKLAESVRQNDMETFRDKRKLGYQMYSCEKRPKIAENALRDWETQQRR
ncbi:GM15890 [Drosophila sechellia]|uniref:GM15890 n=1 Tax=Drosophila sechellia TaxID=7238 RepID=B4I813_DROSE|nr:GM15890 [Drosophila sechellia]